MRLSGRSDRVLAPGQSDSVTVTLQSRGRSGPVSKSIRVTTNDPAHKSMTLTCKGSVRSALKGRALSAGFGRIGRDSGSITKTVTLERGDGGPIAPEVLPIGMPGLTAAIREVNAGEKYELDVTLSPPWPNERIRTTFNIKTGVDKSPTEQIRVSAEVDPRVRTQPPSFTLPREFPAASDYTVDIAWDKEGPQKILSAEINDPNITVQVEEADNKQRLALHVPAGYEQRKRQALVVTVLTDDTDMPKFTVPVRFQRPSRARGAKPPVNKLRDSGRDLTTTPPAGKHPTAAKKLRPSKVSLPVKKTIPPGAEEKPEKKKEKPSTTKDR